ncbi:MAG: rhodanese-like domain-containing protein [Dehalobacterium sp.]
MSKMDYFKAKVEATISPMDFMQAAKAEPDKFLVVDVRNAPPHIMKQKIAGASHIPLMHLSDRLGELPKDKTIVVYCWETWCNMAAKAAIILLENGYDVLELTGGIAAWTTMGFPVEPAE